MTDTQTTGAGLMAAILADPADDDLRLIYADWLEEHGDLARAEFIRVQVELDRGWRATRDPAAKHLTGQEVAALRRRELELLGPPWVASGVVDWPPFPRNEWAGWLLYNVLHPSRWIFRRGFVAALTCTAAGWLAAADAILASQPIETVTLTTLPSLHQKTNRRGKVEAYALCAEYARAGWWYPHAHVIGIAGLCDLAAEMLAAEWPHITFHLPVS